MDYREYYSRALELHKREKAAIEAIIGNALMMGAVKATGDARVAKGTTEDAIAHHQEIVAEMVKLGAKFRGDA